MKKMNWLGILLATVAIASCGKRPGTNNTGAESEPAPSANISSDNTSSQVQYASTASRYEGKIVRRPQTDGGKEDGWFLVENGKRRWIMDGAWLSEHGRSPGDVVEIPADELAKIPEDPNPLGQ
ncbi:hypothetical protein EAT51_02890 [Pseudoxanthomonas winnipegensis]|uniref:hypothetical protein n=1 Tax=Pseudoxanthomonas winnipegensis TaxID=2480810 RepID=UPI00102DEE7A|nr:hypothetical protein [Pseudoxanthomonas winnipegensis]TAA44349.1 hypothetical protein EAT51_02890 [Pseudoxanthomonas winnipegensis]